MPPPSRSERNAILLPSGENAGSDSSDRSFVRATASPVASCCLQISRSPLPARSDAYATSLPSGENAGSVVRPESEVSRLKLGAGVGGAGRVSHHVRVPVAASRISPTREEATIHRGVTVDDGAAIGDEGCRTRRN